MAIWQLVSGIGQDKVLEAMLMKTDRIVSSKAQRLVVSSC